MKIRLLALALIAMSFRPALATEVTYNISGTFQNLSGSYYSVLSGGSFTGTFVAPANVFPLSSATTNYLDSFQINIYTASGTLFSTLSSNVAGSYEYFTNNYVSSYGGEQLGFIRERNGLSGASSPHDVQWYWRYHSWSGCCFLRRSRS